MLGQKKRLLPQNRKLPLERTFMVFIFKFILSHWSLQLSWQEVILLLDVHFLLIISAVPLDTSTLSQQAQTQGIQIAAQKSECPIHISVEIRLLYRKQSPKLLQVTLYKQFQPTWDEDESQQRIPSSSCVNAFCFTSRVHWEGLDATREEESGRQHEIFLSSVSHAASEMLSDSSSCVEEEFFDVQSARGSL